jgi:hypothetical protein
MENGLPRKHNWWLVGISTFTAVLFAVQAVIAYQALTIRQDGYYLVSLVVFAGLTIFSIFAVIQGWRNALPGQRRTAETAETEEPTQHEA